MVGMLNVPHPPWHPPMTLEIMDAVLDVCNRRFGGYQDGVKDPVPVAQDYQPVDGRVHWARLRNDDGSKYVHAFVNIKHVPTKTYWTINWFQDDVWVWKAENIRPDTLTMQQAEKNGYSFLGGLKLAYKYNRWSYLYPLREGDDDAGSE